jgi:hypothetical protein
MRVLTATNQTQGWRNNDFCWAIEDELVFFLPLECDRVSIDDRCGCRRAMAGAVSHRATTTIKVADRDELDPETYLVLITDGLHSQGYVTTELMKQRSVNRWVRDITEDLMRLATGFEVGTVLERRGDFVKVRKLCRD